jgi:hypothetical protein
MFFKKKVLQDYVKAVEELDTFAIENKICLDAWTEFSRSFHSSGAKTSGFEA